MGLEKNEIGWIGFFVFLLSLSAAMFIFGMFAEHRIVSDLLFLMYVLGLTTTIGLLLFVSTFDKKRKVKE